MTKRQNVEPSSPPNKYVQTCSLGTPIATRTFSKLLTLYPMHLLASGRLVFDGEGLLVNYDFINKISILMVLKAIFSIRN